MTDFKQGQSGGPPAGMSPLMGGGPNGAPMYYMYPSYGQMPPMPVGSPMYYMGGMWGPPGSPMMPMMPYPQQSPAGGGGRGGRGGGRGHNKSPRAGRHPSSPNHGQQRPRGNSYGNRSHGQQQQGPYGHGYPMPPQGSAENMGVPVVVSYDAVGNPLVQMVMQAASPGEVAPDDVKDKSQKGTRSRSMYTVSANVSRRE